MICPLEIQEWNPAGVTPAPSTPNPQTGSESCAAWGTHDVKRRRRVRGPRDRASKVSTCGADGVGKLEGSSSRSVLVRGDCPTGVQERGTRTSGVPQEPGRPPPFPWSIPGWSPGDQGPGRASVRTAPARGANEAVQHGYGRPSPPRAAEGRQRSRSTP